jgi:outer membrane receptor protein involved in Fe transport
LATAALAAASAAVTAYPPAFFAAAQPNTAFDMVKLLPGFTYDPGGGARGLIGAAGNVLIDGSRPAAKDDSLTDILRRIPAQSVARIDVIRGGAPGVDMQGKTVVANVIRRVGGGPTLTVNASLIALDDGRVGYGLRLEGAGRLGTADWEGSFLVGRDLDDDAGDGPRTQTAPGGALVETAHENSSGAQEDYKVTGAVETPAAGGKLRVNASLFVSPYHYLQDDHVTDPPSLDDENDHYQRDTAELGVRYDRGLGPGLGLETYLVQQFGQSRFGADYTAPDDVETFSLAKNSAESIARTTLNARVGPGLSIQTGGEGDFNWLLDHTDYVVNAVPTAVPAADVRVTEARAEAFATTTWRASGALTLEAGLRVEASRIASSGDVNSARAFVFPKPSAVITWSPDEADQLRVRIEREVGQLDFDDFAAGTAPLSDGAVRAGNPDLTPQQDWVYEAAIDRRFWGGAQATVTLRHFDLTDVIDRAPVHDPAGDYDAPGNIGPGTKDEAAMSLTLPTDRLGVPRGVLTALATARQSRVIDPTTGLARSISGLHPLDTQARFTQGLPRWKATWGFNIFGQWQETYYRFDEIDTDKLKTYGEVFVEYRPRPGWALRVEIDNVGGRGFRHIRQVYADDRNDSPLEYTDIRDLHGNRGLYLRLRKTFN